MDIPLNAKVYCTNGFFGRSTRIILNPKDKKISHIVVKEDRKPHIERNVPTKMVQKASPQEIQLNCTQEKAHKMETFIAIEYVPVTGAAYGQTDLKLWPQHQVKAQQEKYYKLEYERIPLGELALRKGAKVRAKDGPIGHVREFLVNPNNGHITHLVLREGHFWGHKDIAIDMSYVEQIEEKTIYLGVDKFSISKMPPLESPKVAKVS